MNVDIRTDNPLYKECMTALLRKKLNGACSVKYGFDTMKILILPDDADCLFLPHSSELLEVDNAVIFCTPAIKRILSGLFYDRNVCLISLDGKVNVITEKLLVAMGKLLKSASTGKRRRAIFETLTVTESRTLDFIMHTGQGETLSKTQSLHKRNAMHKLGVANTFELYCKIKLAEALAEKMKAMKGTYIDFLLSKGSFAGECCTPFEAYELCTVSSPFRHMPFDSFFM